MDLEITIFTSGNEMRSLLDTTSTPGFTAVHPGPFYNGNNKIITKLIRKKHNNTNEVKRDVSFNLL